MEAFDNTSTNTTSANLVTADNILAASRTGTIGHTDGASTDTSLMFRSALERVVHVSTIPMAINSTVDTNINPYNSILSNSFIADKLANFNGIRAGLKLNFRVNATPFHYGKLLISYLPLHLYKRGTSLDAPHSLGEACQLSQVTNSVVLDISGSSMVEMEVPYIYPRDFIALKGEFTGTTSRLTATQTFVNVGLVRIRSLGTVRNASTSVDPISLVVTGSLVEPHLALPTTQSGTEFAEKPISTLASAGVKAADYASKFGSLAPFAKATSTVFRAVGGAASALGWSRVDSVDAPMPMRPEFIGNMAVTDRPELSAPLALDSKNETAVTPDVVRLDLPDELEISTFCGRSGIIYLDDIPVPTVTGGYNLWVPVTPYVRISGGVPLSFTMPPCAVAASLFHNWRGMMRYKFSMVKSQVHTGRIQIRHDALVSSQGTSSSITELKTTFWNLGDSDSIEICVPWQQGSQFLPSGIGGTTTSSGSPTVLQPTATSNWNGALHLSIVNDVVCSTASTSPLTLVVSVSMDSPEFMGPDAGIADMALTPAQLPAVQSGVEPCDQSMEGCVEDTDATLYGGEKVLSLRPLLRRYVPYYFAFRDNNGTRVLWNRFFPRDHVPPGEVAAGTGLNTRSTSGDINYTVLTPASYLASCFALARGSSKYKYSSVSSGTTRDGFTTLTRTRENGVFSTWASEYVVSQTDSNAAAFTLANQHMGGTAGTSAMVPGFPQTEITYPYYNRNYATITNKADFANLLLDGTRDENFCSSIYIGSTNTESKFTIYAAAGTDYNMYYYTFCPLFIPYGSLIPA